MVLQLLHVPERSLYKSEPPPAWFGNPENERSTSWTAPNWLTSRFHFSFAEWRGGPSSFGALRVLNDDLVQPHRGFGRHPHRDMEIVTYIIDGKLTHQDSMGTSETLGRGSVQFMSAGTGIMHSEHNKGDSSLRFMQIWIMPRERGLEPQYGGYDGTRTESKVARKNRLQHLVGDRRADPSTCVEGNAPPVLIEQDCNIHVTELDPGNTVSLSISKGRQAYVVCAEGMAELSENKGAPLALARHEAARVTGDGDLHISAGKEPAHVLLLEMKRG